MVICATEGEPFSNQSFPFSLSLSRHFSTNNLDPRKKKRQGEKEWIERKMREFREMRNGERRQLKKRKGSKGEARRRGLIREMAGEGAHRETVAASASTRRSRIDLSSIATFGERSALASTIYIHLPSAEKRTAPRRTSRTTSKIHRAIIFA